MLKEIVTTMPNYTTSQAAEKLAAGQSTVRKWARDYAEFLSETARREMGYSREYTDTDLAVMSLVARLNKAGKRPAYIRASLRALLSGELSDAEADAVELAQPTLPQMKKDRLEHKSGMIRELFGRIDALERQAEMLLQENSKLHQRVKLLEFKLGIQTGSDLIPRPEILVARR
jgi:DNA-binding transcriptional MerR regulator